MSNNQGIGGELPNVSITRGALYMKNLKTNSRPSNPQVKPQKHASTNSQNNAAANAQLPPIDPQAVLQASQPHSLIGWPLEQLNQSPAADPAQSAQIESLQQDVQHLRQRVQQLLEREQVQTARIQSLYDQLDQRDAQIRRQELQLQSQESQRHRDRRRAAVPEPMIDPMAPTAPMAMIRQRATHSGLVRTCLNCMPALLLVAFGYGLLTLVAGLLGATGWAIALVDLGSWVGRVLLTGVLILTAIAAFGEGL